MRLALLLIVGGGSVLAYIILAMTINGQPPYRPFPGWVTVWQRASQPRGDEVQLEVHSFTMVSGNGSPLYISPHPLMAYEVAVCGLHPYHGDLLIGGAARLIHTPPLQPGDNGFSLLPGLTGQVLPLGSFRRVPDLSVDATAEGAPFEDVGDAGPVQVASFTVSKPPPCPAQPSSNFPREVVVMVLGAISAPVEQSWTAPFGWWHGPHMSAAWPLAGSLSLTADSPFSPGFRWSYRGLTGLMGTWSEPTPEYVQVSTHDVPLSPYPGVPLTWSIDAAQPTVTPITTEQGNVSLLSWSSTGPIDPMARLTDGSSLASLQNWLIVAAVGMGIGGSMLASMAFEMLDPRLRVAIGTDEEKSPSAIIDNPAQSGTRDGGSHRLRHRTLVVIAALAIGFARRRQAHRGPWD
jgi:hypothetical protein